MTHETEMGNNNTNHISIGMREPKESSNSQFSGDDRCACGERSVGECRSGCWGTDECVCGGSCDGMD